MGLSRRSIISAGACLFAVQAWPQTQITSALVDGVIFAPTTFLTVSVFHDGPGERASFSGSVSTREGATIVRFRTGEVVLRTGDNVLASVDLALREFSWGSGALALAAQREHRLAGGEYKVCIDGVLGGESLTPYCEPFDVEEVLFLDLTEPWDRDTIDEVRPALYWTLTGSSAPKNDLDLLLTLAPLNEEKSAQRAVGSSVPVFRLPDPSYPLVPYPSGVPSLEPGRCYAWQVSALRRGIIRERSEAWSFCVRKRPTPVDDRYILLRDNSDATIHRVLNERIHFRFDEPYSVWVIHCEVLNAEHTIISPDASLIVGQGRTVTPNLRNIGVNLYEFDLSSYHLSTGRYELRVKDGKDRERSILFSIEVP